VAHIRRIRLHPERYPTDEHHPFNLRVLRETPCLDVDAPVTFFVGENGSGKSSLLEAVCRKCGIHMWQGVHRTRYQYNPYEKRLHHYLSIEWANGHVPGSYFGSEVFQTFATSLDEWASTDPGLLKYFGGKSLVAQSHGQSLMSMFRARYKIKGLYLLDEPETALSPNTQLELVELIRRESAAGHAQFLIATHSPILMSCPEARIYTFDTTPVSELRYEDTEHYKVYKEFFGG
jgi:predicted ATPase